MIECAADAIVAFGTDRTVMLWNPAAERMFGWAAAEAIRWACRHVLAGGSVSAILRDWTARGVKPRFEGRTYLNGDGDEMPFSGKWTHTTVIRILTNPRIAGLATMPNSDEPIGDGTWAPVITPETWVSVRDTLRDPARAMPRGKVSLGGFMFYCRCGSLVQHDVRWRPPKGKVRTSYGMYKCVEYGTRGSGKPGPHVTIKADPIDAYVEMRILDRMRLPDAASIFQRSREGAADVPKLRAERKEISDGLARRVTARLEEIDAQIAEAGKVDATALLLGADDPGDVWPGLDITIQRKIIESLVHVTLRPPGAGCRNPDMNELVRIGWRKG